MQIMHYDSHCTNRKKSQREMTKKNMIHKSRQGKEPQNHTNNKKTTYESTNEK